MTKREHLKQKLEKIDNLIQDCIKTTQEKIKENTPLTDTVKHFDFRKKGYKISLYKMGINPVPCAVVNIKNKLTTSLKFSIHQHQGINIEDYYMTIISTAKLITADYFEYNYFVTLKKIDYLIELEKKVAIENHEAKRNEIKKCGLDGLDYDDAMFYSKGDVYFEYRMTPKQGSIDLLLKHIEKEIQKLTQWRRGGNDLGKKGYVKLLDLPHTKYDAPIILFNEEGNRIKY